MAVEPGIVWALAPFAAITYSVVSARRGGLDPRVIYWTGVLGIVAGIWGGHILGQVYYGTDGRPWFWLRFWSGGDAQYGALIGGALAVVICALLCRLSLARLGDVFAPAIALAVAIGRVGCFLNGDDFGRVSHLPWAVRFPPGTEAFDAHLARGWTTSTDAWSLPVHPVQLYCTLIWLGIFLLLLVHRRNQRPGECFALFLMAHGMGRMVEQFFRGDFQPVLGPLSLTQLISLALILAGGCLWLVVVRIAKGQRGTRDLAAPAAAIS
jgi:phosphatidylglycerol:prolipoprotein diacylglycerol transferase